jgi:hypothetical protein
MTNDEGSPGDDGIAPDYTIPPWILAFHGLSESRAGRILELAEREGIAYGASLFPPRDWFELTFDRVTAEWLRAALSEDDSVVTALSGDSLISVTPHEARQGMEGIIADLDEFLDGDQGD